MNNPFRISGLTNGQPYKIQVRACNNHVVSDPSPEYSFIAVKQLPSSLVATRLLWLDATDSTTVEKSGDNVVVWKDKTEFGNHFTTSSAIKYSDTTTTIIDYTRVKYLSFNNNLDTTFQYSANTDPRIAYVADKGNHCIRLLNVDQSFVSTVAGICGSPS
jgi:hypothetical protein